MEELVCGCGKSQEIRDRQDSPSREHVQDRSPRRFVRVESGIYRDAKTGRFYERPTIDGKRTWRKLVGDNLGFSREESCHRRAAVARGQDPYHKKRTPTEAKPANSKEEARTVGDVIRRYQRDGYPDKHLLSRPESTRASEEQHCHTLLPFWNSIELTAVTFPVCDDYRDWRLGSRHKGRRIESDRLRAEHVEQRIPLFKKAGHCDDESLGRPAKISALLEGEALSRIHAGGCTNCMKSFMNCSKTGGAKCLVGRCWLRRIRGFAGARC